MSGITPTARRTSAGRISAEERRPHPGPARARPAGQGQVARTVRPAMPAPPAHYYCSDAKGPDWDFSAGVMLVDLPNGKNLVVAGQKSGVVWAFDPDQKGELVWKSDISRGEILFGAAADDENGYFGMRGGALTAVRLRDGVEQWTTYIDPQPSMESHRGVSAAVSVVPGVVFAPGLDGTLRAFSTFDGRQLWQYDTTQKVKTVNGVSGKGGSIGSAGAVVVNGMVFVTFGLHRIPERPAGKPAAGLRPAEPVTTKMVRRSRTIYRRGVRNLTGGAGAGGGTFFGHSDFLRLDTLLRMGSRCTSITTSGFASWWRENTPMYSSSWPRTVSFVAYGFVWSILFQYGVRSKISNMLEMHREAVAPVAIMSLEPATTFRPVPVCPNFSGRLDESTGALRPTRARTFS